MVFDHLTRRVALLRAGSEAERLSLRKEVIAALRGSIPASDRANACGEATAALAREDYMELVSKAKRKIRDGEIFQLVLSNRFSGECDLDPFRAYRALRLINPSPYMYFIEIGGRAIAGSSPEALVKLRQGPGRVAAHRPALGPAGATRRKTDALSKACSRIPRNWRNMSCWWI